MVKDSYIMKEIDKTMNFVKRKIYEGKLLIDILDRENNTFVKIENGSYSFYEGEEKNQEGFKGVLVLSENIHELEKFKLEIRKIIWKLDNNGFIIIKYVNNHGADVDLEKEEFENFLNDEGFVDIESYIVLNRDSNDDKSKQGLVLISRFHEDLLAESPEYEEYTINSIKENKCGGCSDKKGGCSGKNGGCGSCTGCCKK